MVWGLTLFQPLACISPVVLIVYQVCVEIFVLQRMRLFLQTPPCHLPHLQRAGWSRCICYLLLCTTIYLTHSSVARLCWAVLWILAGLPHASVVRCCLCSTGKPTRGLLIWDGFTHVLASAGCWWGTSVLLHVLCHPSSGYLRLVLHVTMF